jgi:glycyl-tRNA synthetase alpha subunit
MNEQKDFEKMLMEFYRKGFDDCEAEAKKTLEHEIKHAILLEREACAQLCDELSNEVGNKNFIAVDQRQFCAKQIRARGNHEQD